MKHFCFGLIFIMIGCILSACSIHSSHPTAGLKMILQGKNTQDMGEDWIKGKKLIKEGHDNINKGHANIKKGKSQVRKGHSMIQKGEKLMASSENKFHQQFPEIELSD